MKTTNVLLFSVAASLLLAGCAIGPNYEKPNIETPKQYTKSDGAKDDKNVTNIDKKWWKSFGDEGLSEAVDKAIKVNYDIKIASAQVDAVLGQFDEAKSYLYPHINASGSLTRKGVSGSTDNNLKNGVTNTFAASLAMASYEIDLFGKVRRATEAARAMLLASEYNRRATHLSVASATAASYARLSSMSAQVEIAKENITTASEIEKITKKKYDLGYASEVDWLQSLSQLEGAKATLAQLEASKIAESATLNVLLGQTPTKVDTSVIDNIKIPVVPVGLPSDILARRPDIGAAEQNLIAANARIGVAKGAYFPSISLTGMFGNQSSEFSKLFSSPTKLWQVAPSINLPLFTAGMIAGQVKEAEAGKDQSLAQYQKTVIAAFNDADSAIGQNYHAKEQDEASQKRAEAMQKAFESAKLRYKVGTISYADMLIVQQNWLSAKQQSVIAKQNRIITTINLYKALGGGWDDKETPEFPSLLPAGR